ncbi:biotin carboxylase [Verminephrobacter eiseniae]|nr:biotin carboxylase [Verminephrobacter eiseniae]
MMSQSSTLLIIDYNLSRVEDVARIAEHARTRHGARSLLIRADPSAHDASICEDVIDLDPTRPDFVEQALARLTLWRDTLRGGLVFSDNAVQSGAQLLERLGLRVDCANLALGAFNKHTYRQSEAVYSQLLRSQRVLVPDCVGITSVAELQSFANAHPDGFVVKPSCEGNNRGVVIVRPGDNLQVVLDEVAPYLANGVICEQFIPYRREYSYDGIGALSFITEKVSASGRYPVEIAQVLPARLSLTEQHTLQRTGYLCNLLVGQRDGPFHNEIKMSDDGAYAAVVEPNRRPGGMKIWSLAKAVYGVDLYALWVDTVLSDAVPVALPPPLQQAATVMLGISQDDFFTPRGIDGDRLFAQALAATAQHHDLQAAELRIGEFGWLTQEHRFVHAVPRDNADFIAQATVVLDAESVDIRHILQTLRTQWLTVLLAVQAAQPDRVRSAVPVLEATV